MNARARDSAKAGPLPMTDADVTALARGGETALAGRIAKHSPTKAIGTLTGKKAAPPRITASEMNRIQRTGVVPPQLRDRLAKAAESDVPPKESRSKKDSPKIDPTRGSKG